MGSKASCGARRSTSTCTTKTCRDLLVKYVKLKPPAARLVAPSPGATPVWGAASRQASSHPVLAPGSWVGRLRNPRPADGLSSRDQRPTAGPLHAGARARAGYVRAPEIRARSDERFAAGDRDRRSGRVYFLLRRAHARACARDWFVSTLPTAEGRRRMRTRRLLCARA